MSVWEPLGTGPMSVPDQPQSARGLSPEAAEQMDALMQVFQANATRNAKLERYYSGRIPWDDVRNAVPDAYRGLEVGCDWGAIAVQSVVERSVFDGYVFADPESDAAQAMHRMFARDAMAAGYQRALVGALVHGCAFGAVVMGQRGPSLRWHTARTASALWDVAERRPECGMAVVATRRDPETHESRASEIDLYTQGGVWELSYDGHGWSAEFAPDAMGRPRFVALTFRADDRNPLGHSRFTRGMKFAMREYVANALNVHIASDLYAIGQKALLGVTQKQYEQITQNKWATSMDSIVVATRDRDGNAPVATQWVQQSMEPLLSVKRSLATDFASAASIPVSELLSQDSNPTSAEALRAAQDKLISLVESVNRANSEPLADAARMMMAMEAGGGLADLGADQWDVGVHWRNPATPNEASIADATIKFAQAIEGYGLTTVAQERMGFDAGERARLQGELRRIQARQGMTAILDRNRGEVDAAVQA